MGLEGRNIEKNMHTRVFPAYLLCIIHNVITSVEKH